MPKGGHASSGPPPDAGALRRDRPSDIAGWTTLPAEGYQGDVPAWPLTVTAFTHREIQLWDHVWRTPQAAEWSRLGMEIEVAMYVRNLAHAEAPRCPALLQTIVLRYLDNLGLSVQGMLRHRWRIGAQAAPAERVNATVQKPRPSARSRLTVVSDE